MAISFWNSHFFKSFNKKVSFFMGNIQSSNYRMKIFSSPITVFIFFFSFYLLTITSNFTAPHDSMTYLYMIKSGEHLWHPHHLLYHVSSLGWVHMLRPFFPNVREYFLVEIFDMFWGTAALCMVFLFFRKRFFLPVITSWLGTALAGFSFGIWFYSTNVEVYMPPLFFALFSLFIISKKDWQVKDVLAVALLHSLAILYHQMYILFTLIVLYKLFEQRKNISLVKSLVIYASIGIILVGSLYLYAGIVQEGRRDFSSFLDWTRGYTETTEWWTPLGWTSPLLAGIGFSHSILGGHFILKEPMLQQLFSSFLHKHALEDEFYLVRNLSPALATVLSLLTLVFLVCVLILLISWFKRISSSFKKFQSILIPLLLFQVIFSIYFLFWEPEILEFWLTQCIIFWILLVGVQNATRRFNITLALMVAILVSVNYLSSIRFMRDINNDIGYARIKKILPEVTDQDLVVVRDPWLLKEFLQYLTSAKVETVPVGIDSVNRLKNMISSKLSQGKKVYLFPDVNSKNASGNESFIPSILETYNQREKVIQTDMTKIVLIQ
jgi:hypothetical protein